MSNTTISGIVEDSVQQLFGDVAQAYNLKTGDVSPEMVAELDNIQVKLNSLLKQYVEGNQQA